MSPRSALSAFAFSMTSVTPLALESDKSDTWAEIAKVGEWKGFVDDKGMQRTVKITPEHLACAKAEFDRCVNDLALDFNHANEEAAGWFDELRIVDDKLEGHVTFTDDVAAAVRAKKWKYLSPTWVLNAPDRVTGEKLLAQIPCVGLTNTPFQDGLRPVSLSRTAVRMAIPTAAPVEGDAMPPEEMKKILDAIQKLLGVTDPTQLVAAVEQLAGAKPEADAPMSLPAAMSRIRSKDVELVAMKASLDSATKTIADRKAKDEADEAAAKAKAESDAKAAAEKTADDAVDAAIAAGKILPTARAEYAPFARSDLKGFQALVAKLPEIVPMSKRAKANEKKPQGSLDGSDPVVLSFRRSGWSDERIQQHFAKTNYQPG